MAREAFTYVQAGNPLNLSASEHNAFIDTTKWYLERKHVLEAGQDEEDIVEVLINNTSGADFEARSIVKLGDVSVTPAVNQDRFENDDVFDASVPGDESDFHVITIQKIVDGFVGDAIIERIATVQIEVTDDAHTHANATVGDATKLTSSMSGEFRILYKVSGTGLQWAKVRRAGGGTVNLKSGILDADLLASGANVDVTGTDTESYPSVVNRYKCCGDAGDECVIWEDTDQDPSEWVLLTVEHKVREMTTKIEIRAAAASTATHTHDLWEEYYDASVMTCGPKKERIIDQMGPCDP